MECLVPLLQVQDRDLSFRKVAGSAQVSNAVIVTAEPQRGVSPTLGASDSARRSSGQRIVVFCTDNDVTQTAVEMVALMARAGRDQVFLMTVVPTAVQQAQGKELVVKYYQQLSQVLIQVSGEYHGVWVEMMSMTWQGQCLSQTSLCPPRSLHRQDG